MKKNTIRRILTVLGIMTFSAVWAFAANAMYIAPSGNVGIGTSSPDAKLTIQAGNQQINMFTAGGGEYIDWPYAALSIRRIDDYGQMRMIQLGHRDDSTYQTGNNVWHFSLVNSTANKTTSDSDTRLFIGGPGHCVIWPNGNVGINKWNPAYALDVNGVICGNNVSPSDERLKKNIKSLPNCLEKVTKLRGVSYEWKDQAKGKGTQIGVIAQEVEKEYPEVVLTDKNGYKSVAYDKLVGVLIESTKELQALVKQQQKEIEELKKAIKSK